MLSSSVLIVGAGPVGLSMALALARQNISVYVIEQESAPSNHPRARGVSTRTMELFRLWGDINELLDYEFPKEAIRFIWAQSLQGEEITRIEITDKPPYPISPIMAGFVTQDCVETYLRQMLKRHPQTHLHFSKKLISFTQNETGVKATVWNTKTQKEECIQAKYLIAADGAHSMVRKQLNIELLGPANLGRFCSVYCEFDISKWTAERPSIAYFFADPKIASRSLYTAYGKNRWIVGMRLQPSNHKDHYTDAYCTEEIKRVLNLSDISIRIINKSFWTMAAQIAQHYSHQRVFLIGDAAHRLPPTGGLGMNTGVQDAHNLAWKLAFVLNHGISPKLLETYEEERMPVARRNIEWSQGNAKRFVEIFTAIQTGDTEKLKIKLHEQQDHFQHFGLDLGSIYHSKAILSENDQTISINSSQYVPTTLPGARAPHVKLIKNGKEISTLDLFENDYVLLIGSAGGAWQDAAQSLAEKLQLPLKSYRIGIDTDLQDPDNTWHTTYEITSSGAVLIRPDGHVAWRSTEIVKNPQKQLLEIWNAIHFCHYSI